MINRALGAAVLIASSISFCRAQQPPPPFSTKERTYQTGNTAVSEKTTSSVAATVVPVDLSLQAHAQTLLATAVANNPAAQGLGAKQPTNYLPDCDPKAHAFDWKSKGAVSPVKDQGDCGSCFIFASTGALEASWFLQNNQRVSLSEQQALDCAKAGQCSGGWHGAVLNFFKTPGITGDTEVKYVGHPNNTCLSTAHPYSAVNWNYVDKNGATASPAAIKEAICTHGPVVSAVFATDDFKRYTGGVFNEFAEGDGSSSVNHDVLIVGWDDSKDAWLIKNSWGEQSWGEQGYMWLRYRSNYIGFGAAWVDAVKLDSPNTSTAADFAKAALQASKLNNAEAKNILKNLDPKSAIAVPKDLQKLFGIRF